MRVHRFVALALVFSAVALSAQRPDKELVATLTAPMLDSGIVVGLAWDGGTLIIQSASMDTNGVMKPGYFTTPGKGMDVMAQKQAPPALMRYWKMKSSRVSPTGLGKITTGRDASMPMYGIASLEQRLADAHEFGGTRQVHELRIDQLILHSRTTGIEPYDGEVWSWSPAALNRIAYVDGKGDLWIARADGNNNERLLKGNFTLPAWSEDGRTLAIAERKDEGRKWEVSVIHLPEQFRQ
jgi:hypothetical protein